MLATFSVTNTNDGFASGTIRQAVLDANSSGGPDEIVISNSLAGQTIVLSLGPLVLNDRAIIRGPSGSNQVTIRQSGSTTTAFVFQNFEQDPSGEVDGLQGVENIRIENFDIAIEVQNIFDTDYRPEEALVIEGNTLANNSEGIRIENSKLLYKIRNNVITGDGGVGAGIRIDNVDQGTSLQFLPDTSKPFIGGTATGNVIGNHGHGIFVDSSYQPDLSIIGNRIGADVDGLPVPNGIGIALEGEPSPNTLPDVGRIASNDIVYNNGEGILIQFKDGVTIENNLIGANVGDGIRLLNQSQEHIIRDNLFDSNGKNGINIEPVTNGDNSASVEITRNEYVGIATGFQPIDLGNDGPTANDAVDFDGLTDGPNRLLNYPVVDNAQITLSNGVWDVPVDFDALEDVDYRFEFYRYDSLLGNYTYIRSATVQTGPQPGTGDISASYTFQDGIELNAGDRIGVVAIQLGGTGIGDTSELSLSSLSQPLAVPDTTGPSITEVVISSSASGSDRSYYDLVNEQNLETGDQIRALDFIDADTIEITFSEEVNISGSELQLESIRTSMAYSLTYVGATGNTHKWVVAGGETLDGDDQVLIILPESIQDTKGNNLDGEWINPISLTTTVNASLISEFPSGDGTPGGDFRFVFTTAILGDYNGDNQVSQADLDDVLLDWGQAETNLLVGWAPGLDPNDIISQSELDAVLLNWGTDLQVLFFYGDFNNDGLISQADLDLVLLNWGQDESSVPEIADEVFSDLNDTIGQWELDGVLLSWGNWFATNINPDPQA